MRVLVTDHLHPLLVERLEAMGHEVDVRADIDNAGVAEILSGYGGLVVATKIRVTAELLDRAPGLRFVGRAGSGMENIDREAAAARGVACVNSPEGNREAVAEHAVGMLLALFNHLPRGDREFRAGLFRREPNRGLELGGRTVGIVGYGHTGSAVARRLAGFGVRVLAHDKYRTGFGGALAREAPLEALYEEADVLSLHLPLSPETHHWLDDERVARFARPFHLVNTARGPVVDTAALVRALDAGRVLGACLDVFENERPERWTAADAAWWEALRHRENVLFSPHVAGWTVESRVRIARVLADRIEALDLGAGA
jgi:D-3-phosphoglycerate dehydrogenase